MLTTVSAYPDRVVIDVSDCGCGFSISDEEEPPETGQFAERGRGVKLMRLLMDAVSIQEKPSGNGPEFEPGIKALQASALPLGHLAI